MTVRELREKYLAFFESKGHKRFPSGSLIPYDVTGRLDESLLFNGAGMVQFKPYFRGIAQPEQKRLITCQKCLRTGDIDEVGDLTHLTFFEMLGNFSFGDYFKADAIAYSWEFLTSKDWLGLDPTRLSFTIFEDDDEAYAEWSKWFATVGIDPATRVFRLDEDTNYWPAGSFSKGPPGPCGPNSEMFYWVSKDPPPAPGGAGGGSAGGYSREDWLRDEGVGKWLEIWNDVFIQYEWQGHLKNPDRPSDGFVKDGMPELPFRSVDTGMGLDRTAAVLMGGGSVYETDSFAPIFAKIAEIEGFVPHSPPPIVSGGTDIENANAASDRLRSESPTHGNRPRAVAKRIIADHIRAAVFCIVDGVLPGNSGRGYVLRRLIRRAVLKGQRVLRFQEPFFHRVYEGVVDAMGDFYPELIERRDTIVETLKAEEEQFRRTLQQGQDHLARLLRDLVTSRLYSLQPVLGSMLANNRLVVGGEAAWVLDQFEPQRFISGPASPLPYEDAAFAKVIIDNYTTLEEVQELGRDFSELCRQALAVLASSSEGWEQFGDPEDLGAYLQPKLIIAGGDGFRLYDTYGFPFEVTQELAAEAGVEVDIEGYEQALKDAQERSRGGHERENVYGDVGVTLLIEIEEEENSIPTPTVFVGYDHTKSQTEIVGVLPGSTPDQPWEPSPNGLPALVVALKESPFYAESGGQVSDTGTIAGGGFEGNVLDVIKQNGVWIHEVEPLKLPFDLTGKSLPEMTESLQKKLFRVQVEAEIDAPRRARITRNHTATHLLHAALRQTLGKHVTQAGSYVGPDRLRFDFTHGKALTEQELGEIEKTVNDQILLNTMVVIHQDLAIAEAKAKGAMALFGEKYGERVRMVEIGEFSKELCGGIHVGQTGEIGLFKIIHESSAASGVRRIEALTGEGAYEWVLELVEGLHQAATKLKLAPKSSMKDVVTGIEKLHESQRDLKQRLQRAAGSGQRATGETKSELIKGVELVVEAMKDADARDAASLADNLAANQPNRVVLVGSTSEGKVTFTCKAGAGAVAKGAHAGNLIKEVAKIAGGGGGGRPDFATAGGKDPGKLEEALGAAKGILETMVP